MIIDGDNAEPLDRVLILAPYRRDADFLRRLLVEHDIMVDIAADAAALGEWLARTPGIVVATHEALAGEARAVLGRHLDAQPPWSEMPIVVLLDRSAPAERIRDELRRGLPHSRLMFYQRPVTPMELVSGVQSAIFVRMRQREVRDHINREIELRRELNHRVKNILASVSSIFEMTNRGTTMDEFAVNFRGRLGALASVHAAVFQTDGEAIDIVDIVKLIMAPYRHEKSDRIETGGPHIMLTRTAGTTLALCLHELLTNAIKYGALCNGEGRVEVTWSLIDNGAREMALSWRETGGPEVDLPKRTGYGTRYIGLALKSVFGRKPEISFTRDGLRCEVAGPIPTLS